MPEGYTKLSTRLETFIVELLLPAEITTAMAIVDLKTSIGFGNARIRALIDVTDEVSDKVPGEPSSLAVRLRDGTMTPSEAQAAMLDETIERYGRAIEQMNPGLGRHIHLDAGTVEGCPGCFPGFTVGGSDAT